MMAIQQYSTSTDILQSSCCQTGPISTSPVNQLNPYEFIDCFATVCTSPWILLHKATKKRNRKELFFLPFYTNDFAKRVEHFAVSDIKWQKYKYFTMQ